MFNMMHRYANLESITLQTGDYIREYDAMNSENGTMRYTIISWKNFCGWFDLFPSSIFGLNERSHAFLLLSKGIHGWIDSPNAVLVKPLVSQPEPPNMMDHRVGEGKKS